MKLGAKAAPAPAETPADTAPAEETSTDDTDLDFGGDAAADDTTQDTGNQDTGASDKPFDDTPFDAGVEADEESDPKKFIEQLTGKLGQSLRKYNEDQGQPDFELEKFAVNSLLSATHTGEMNPEDQKDIIKKVKSSGKGDGDEESSDTEDTSSEEPTSDETGTEETPDAGSEEVSSDDSENMFEAGMLDEMSLEDNRAKELIQLYANSDYKTQVIITRLVCGNDSLAKKRVIELSDGDILSSGAQVDGRPFVGARTPSGKIHVNIIYPNKDSAVTATWGKSTTVGVIKPDEEKFLKDLHDDIDKEEIDYIFSRLKDLGVYTSDLDKMFENAMILQNPKKNNMFQEGSNDILDEYEIYEVVEEGKKKKKKTKKDACYHKVRARYDVWPSAYASGALVKCRAVGAANWGNSTDESVEVTEAEELDNLKEKWSAKYKKSIDCNNPKGFSQRAHCQGKKKHE